MRRTDDVLIASVAALASLAACHAPAAPRAPTCPAGDVAIRTQADLDALAGCRVLGGAVSIRTAAPLDLHPLDSLDEIRGDLAIGPTLAIGGVDGFAHLRVVGGAIRLSSNTEATGAYFPALERCGALVVDGNLALAELMAPRLAAVAGDVIVTHNGALEVVDLGALAHVGGHVVFDGNRQLGPVQLPGSNAPVQ